MRYCNKGTISKACSCVCNKGSNSKVPFSVTIRPLQPPRVLTTPSPQDSWSDDNAPFSLVLMTTGVVNNPRDPLIAASTVIGGDCQTMPRSITTGRGVSHSGWSRRLSLLGDSDEQASFGSLRLSVSTQSHVSNHSCRSSTGSKGN